MVSIHSRTQSAADVVIVGGGPAGLAAAIALRAKSIDCLVVDALKFPIDKGCGEGLMPDALESLEALGIQMTSEDGYPLDGVLFANTRHAVAARFPNKCGIGVRRTHLHQRMSDYAREVGVKLAWHSRVSLLDDGKLFINGVRTQYRWLIGADGAASQVRKWAGLDQARVVGQRFGFRRHYQIAPWSNFVEVHWGLRSQLYITPVGSSCVCVVLITRSARGSDEEFFSEFPEVAEKLKGAPMVGSQRGAASITRRLKRVATNSVALIGDASGSVDSITGEGLALSFRQATALASSIEHGSLNQYAKTHRAIATLPHLMAKLMLTMDRWPAMEKRCLNALASNSSFFQELLSVHIGVKKLSSVALRSGPLFGWRLLNSNG